MTSVQISRPRTSLRLMLVSFGNSRYATTDALTSVGEDRRPVRVGRSGFAVGRKRRGRGLSGGTKSLDEPVHRAHILDVGLVHGPPRHRRSGPDGFRISDPLVFGHEVHVGAKIGRVDRAPGAGVAGARTLHPILIGDVALQHPVVGGMAVVAVPRD